MAKLHALIRLFAIPLIVFLGIILYLAAVYLFHQPILANIIVGATILVGSLELIQDTFASILKKKFALDYIAILAITVGIISGQLLVASVIVLMLAGGNSLEKYGTARAQRSLTALVNRIPSDVHVHKDGHIGKKVPVASVRAGTQILIRRGEVIPLDGILITKSAYIDESSLTGEPYMMDKVAGDAIRSGTVNAGDSIVIRVTKEDKDSTYRKIIDMVKRAQEEKSPMIRLADRYSGIFTFVTFALSLVAYLLSRDLTRVLAVLVVATPCPLILATPIALMGGMNSAAKKRIILKRLSAIEVLSRVQALILDKTGTLTLGRPKIKTVEVSGIGEKDAIEIAAAIERNSLHPFAKAIVAASKAHLPAREVKEIIGMGIKGTVSEKEYILRRPKLSSGMTIELMSSGKRLSLFTFEDEVKRDAGRILRKLIANGLHLFLYTGDKEARAQETMKSLGITMEIKAECTPKDKQIGIASLKKQGMVTAMVGDGINDAPALAQADVGMVFSNEEQTASSEAADVIFLGGDLELLSQALSIAQRSVRIALESIWFGIGLSVVGMLFAAVGFLPPIWGAVGQEAIDVAVILNALRASR